MRYIDDFAPLGLLDGAYHEFFGCSVAPSPGAEAVPYRFPANAWMGAACGDHSRLRAAVFQHYFAGALDAGFRRSLPAPAVGGPGMGVGRGSESKFAARIGASQKRLRAVRRGRRSLTATDLAHLFALPSAAYRGLTIPDACREVELVLADRWRSAGGSGPNPVTFPVSGFEIDDRGVRTATHDVSVTGGQQHEPSIPPFDDRDWERSAYVRAQSWAPIERSVKQLWSRWAHEHNWRGAPPEPELTFTMVRPGVDRWPPGLSVDLYPDEIIGHVRLRGDWNVRVGRNANVADTFVVDVIDQDADGRPRLVDAAFIASALSDSQRAVVVAGRARVVGDDPSVLVDWVEPERARRLSGGWVVERPGEH